MAKLLWNQQFHFYLEFLKRIVHFIGQDELHK